VRSPTTEQQSRMQTTATHPGVAVATFQEQKTPNPSGRGVRGERRGDPPPREWFYSRLVGESAKSGDLRVITEFIEKNGVDHVDEKGESLLMNTCRRNDPEVVRFLLEKGAQVDRKFEDSGKTVLHKTAACDTAKNFAVLLEYDPDINVLDNKGRTPLDMAARFSRSLDIVKMLVRRGVDVNRPDHGGYTPLHRASVSDSSGILPFLLKHGALPDARITDDTMRTPLHIAVHSGAHDNVKALLDAGASPDPVDIDGDTPLHLACCGGRLQMVEYLCDRGASLTSLNKGDRTPIDLSWNPYVESYLRTLSYPFSASSSSNNGSTKRQRRY